MTPCTTLLFIRNERRLAVARGEHANVTRLNLEEEKHLEKCVTCAASIQPLYFELWPNARIGVDIYVSTN
jgi:hypothetical protein